MLPFKQPVSWRFSHCNDEEGKRISVYNAIRKYYPILKEEFYIEGYINDLVKETFNTFKNYELLVKRK